MFPVWGFSISIILTITSLLGVSSLLYVAVAMLGISPSLISSATFTRTVKVILLSAARSNVQVRVFPDISAPSFSTIINLGSNSSVTNKFVILALLVFFTVIKYSNSSPFVTSVLLTSLVIVKVGVTTSTSTSSSSSGLPGSFTMTWLFTTSLLISSLTLAVIVYLIVSLLAIEAIFQVIVWLSLSTIPESLSIISKYSSNVSITSTLLADAVPLFWIVMV